MSGFALFGALLLLLLAGVVWAAVRGSGKGATADGAAARRDAAIEALRELEFEREAGKLPEEEYRRLRGRLELEAVRARDAATEAALGGAEVVCPSCGRPIEGGEKFCPSCGTSLIATG